MKHLIILSCAFLSLGLLIGSFAFSADLQPSRNYVIEGEIIQGYLKLSDTANNSGIAYPAMLSYVFIANISNLSEIPLRINQVRIYEPNSIITYRSDFTDSEDYIFYPNTSRLVAFTQITGLYGLKLAAFQQSQDLKITWTAAFSPSTGKGSGGILETIDLPFKSISADEFVYNKGSDDNSYFIFGQQPINAWSQAVQMK